MSIGQISINSVRAKIELQSTRPTVNMKQQHAQIQIETELPKVIIDQTECFNTSGLKVSSVLSKEAADSGYQNLLEYISNIASDGDTIAAFEKGGTPLIDIAERNAYPEREFNVVSMPSVRPKIELKRGSLKIDFIPKDLGTMNGVKFDVRIGSLETRYIPGSIKIDYRV